MNIGRILACLWRRHWVEVVAFWVISSLVSWLATRSGVSESSASGVWLGVPSEGFVWLEVTVVVWLTGRVALSQQGFGTFGGWQTRPLRGWVLWTAEALFLLLVFLPALAIRLRCAVELVAPTPEGWVRLWNGNWKGMFWYHGVLFIVLKLVGCLRNLLPRVPREQVSWFLLLVAVLAALSLHRSVLRGTMELGMGSGSSGGRGSLIIVPEDLERMDRGRWLVDGYISNVATVSSANPSVARVPLREGAALTGEGFRLRVMDVRWLGEELVVRVEIVRLEQMMDWGEMPSALTVRYGNGYFGAPNWLEERESTAVLPFVPSVRYSRTARLHSPLVLPENEAGREELMDGAELFVAVGWPGVPGPDVHGLPLPEADPDPMAHRVRKMMDPKRTAFRGDIPYDKAKRELFEVIRQNGVEAVLDNGPWDPQIWKELVRPYLVRFADEGHQPRMLEMLEVNPMIAEVFLEKGWKDEAMPWLRRHLKDGRKLEQEGLLALIGLWEEDMGPMLETQFHQLEGSFGTLPEAMRMHPGVDWERVKREGWKRVKFGYSRHHVRVKWGAELGDKEALRQLLVKAMTGHEGEREILREWFGGEGATERLYEGWDVVAFRDGRWVLGE
jgi:hypothetical protein